MKLSLRQHRAKPSKTEGVTTRAQARSCKRSEAPGSSYEDDEIVSSAWRHAAAFLRRIMALRAMIEDLVDTKNAKAATYMRFSVGGTDPRGIFGSNGP